MSKIKVLPPELISKIAAGEVVERPASVVKELLENAMDAGAMNIRVELSRGGRKFIRVIDDGEGMTPEDAHLALKRHTTSKIETENDLGAIKSYGFRGEALFSIAAVSRLRLLTKPQGALTGMEIRAEAGVIQSLSEAGSPKGTTVEVQDLFFNIPARLKFLKSPATELAQISEIFAKMALANPRIHFQLYHEGKLLAHYPVRDDFHARLTEAFGIESAARMHHFESRKGNLLLEGYAGDPDLNRGSGRWIYLFINRRPVRDRLLFRAAIEGYRDLIPKDRYPVVLLFLDLPPSSVDVNVHPNKWEVRFADSESIYRMVVSAIRQMLETVPWKKEGLRVAPLQARERYERYESELGFAELPRPKEGGIAFRSEEFQSIESQGPSFLGQIKNTYLLFKSPEGLILMDQHAAHERILFEKLEREFSSGTVSRQSLLIPAALECAGGEWAKVEEHSPELLKLGFEIEPSGSRSFWVKGVPEILAAREPLPALKEMVESLLSLDKGVDFSSVLKNLFRLMACHGAIPAAQALKAEEALALFTDLQKCQSPSYCPHGRPTIIKITIFELEKMFGRRS